MQNWKEKINNKIRRIIWNKLRINQIDQKLSGIEENVESLFYYLNQFIDITQIPSTKDSDLRIMQECDAILLAIFDKVCAQNRLTYWLDWGTLLGAVRHHGFIPWDDDTDITMPREDFEKALNILPPILKKYGLTLYEENDRLCLHYNHLQTGIWVDVFPVDTFFTNMPYEEAEREVRKRILSYREYYCQHFGKNPLISYNALSNERKRLFGENDGTTILYWTYAFGQTGIYRKEILFPCSCIQFENFQLKAPHCIDEILKLNYGDYLVFPKSGLLHHGVAEGRLPLSQWAKSNGINMDKVKNKLSKIYEEL